MPINEIADQLNLDNEIKTALVGRDGLLGNALALTEKLEQDSFQAVAALLPQLPGIELGSLAVAQMEAMTWASAVSDQPA